MEKIRKGNDISILWEIMRGTEEVPYDLTGKDLTLYIKSMYKTEKVTDFTTDGNVLKWTFLGKNQSHTGVYSLTLVENEGKEDMHTVDECHAFELVNCSSKVGGDAESHVQIKIVSLKSAILLNAILPDKELNINSTNVVENGAIAREFEATNKRIDELKAEHEENIYAELVALRDSGKLIPGQLYRITDYITTTTQTDTQSAGHPFDVIVLALSESELSEQAWAIHSARDTDGYFASSKLGAWQIWYSLDNDKTRFAWASSSKGRGVIYRMIDEHNNDCPYDFKNISILNEMGGDAYLYAIGGDRDMSSSGVFFNNKIYPSFDGKFRLKAVSITHHDLASLVHNTVIAPNCDHVVAAGPNIKIGRASTYVRISGNSIRVGAGCRDIFLYQAEYTRIGDNCNRINVESNRPASENYYLQNVVFDSSVISINITSPQTASSRARIQNIRVSTGFYSGIDIIVNRELLHETAVAIDSSGNVKQFCIADIIL